MPAHRLPVRERLFSRFLEDEKTGCWNWTRGKTGAGYGAIAVNNGLKLAHRVSYELHFGSLSDDAVVCHSCDNPGCINPKHLFLGTQATNIADKVSKNRQACGERHGRAKLTLADVEEIRAALGVPLAELAAKYGVSYKYISILRSGSAPVWRSKNV